MSPPKLAIGFITDGESFTGDTPYRRALGGSETALVQLARALAARGHQVQVFCRCPEPGDYAGVRYRDRRDLVRAAGEERFEVLVVSRFFAALDLPLQAGLKVLWNHDILDAPQELARRLEAIDLCLVLSRFHANDFAQKVPACAEKLVVTRNGLDLELIARASRGVEPQPGKVTYVSRPERGLKLLLKDIWPRLKEALPHLKLHLCGYQVRHTELPGPVRREHQYIESLLEEAPDVERLGALSKEAFYRHLASCECLLYPCTFPEISCIAALEAQALGTPILTSDRFALVETVRDPDARVPGEPGSPEYIDEYVRRAVALLSDPAAAQQRAQAAREEVWQRHDWALIAAEWEELFLHYLAERARHQPQALAASLVLAGDRQAAAGLLGRSLQDPPAESVPPDPREEELLEVILDMLTAVLNRTGPGSRLGVIAADQGRTATALAQRLEGVVVEEIPELEPPGGPYQVVFIRDRLEREPDPAAFLRRVLAWCDPEGYLTLCVASGAWPLISPGYLGRCHDLSREDILALLPGRAVGMTFLPRGLVGRDHWRYHAGRWLAFAPVAGPEPGELDPQVKLRRVRPAPEPVLQEVQRAGLV